MSAQANAKINPTGGFTAALVVQAAAGDRDAFATLYNDHQPEVYRFLVFRTGNRHLAEDLTSETFIRALRNLDSFVDRPGSGGFGAWLTVIARNIHADHCKAARTRLEVLTPPVAGADDRTPWLESLTGTVESAEETTLRRLEAGDAAATVQAAMESLLPSQQECLRLRFLEELPLAEASARLGRGSGAVKTLTDRAKNNLRANVRRALAAEGVAA
ncbi:RNA polymerase sigma factor [Streptomyces lincolnensis]|uniref:RNA polymerase sigma factor n=1 Tax=Streptomyces lincolnensis TaxID=1915 RepID=UPI001E52B476|nr:sigma-70 family RNA polymerase sigma factor [Streptomyces lincolnensis]